MYKIPNAAANGIIIFIKSSFLQQNENIIASAPTRIAAKSMAMAQMRLIMMLVVLVWSSFALFNSYNEQVVIITKLAIFFLLSNFCGK